MVIDLRKIPIMYMTCDKSIGDRQNSFENMMDNLGLNYEKINGDITNNYNIGVAQGYIKALSKYDPPFLILEDDARIANPTEDFKYVYSIPDDVDALYLGTSIFGRLYQFKESQSFVVSANAGDYLRIFNMLAFHAVLYVSKNYIHECIKTLNEYISYPNGACDDLIAERMWRHNVLAVKRPVFYQQDGHNDRVTLATIKPVIG